MVHSSSPKTTTSWFILPPLHLLMHTNLPPSQNTSTTAPPTSQNTTVTPSSSLQLSLSRNHISLSLEPPSQPQKLHHCRRTLFLSTVTPCPSLTLPSNATAFQAATLGHDECRLQTPLPQAPPSTSTATLPFTINLRSPCHRQQLHCSSITPLLAKPPRTHSFSLLIYMYVVGIKFHFIFLFYFSLLICVLFTSMLVPLMPLFFFLISLCVGLPFNVTFLFLSPNLCIIYVLVVRIKCHFSQPGSRRGDQKFIFKKYLN